MSGLEGAAKGAQATGADAVAQAAKSGSQSALTGTSAGYTPSAFLSGTSMGAGQGALTPTANALANVGEFVAPAVTGGTSGGISGLTTAAAPIAFNPAIPAAGTASIGLGNIAAKQGIMDSLASFGKDYVANVGNIGTGAGKLITGAPGAAEGFKAAGATLSNTALPIAFGLQGAASIDEQRNFLKEQQAAGNIAQAEYDAAMAEINRSEAIAREAVARTPFNTNPDRSASIGDTYYDRFDAEDTLYGRGNAGTTLYAMGGSVDDELGMDDARGLGIGNLSNGFMNMGSTPAYAAGGMLSHNLALRDLSQPAFNEGAVGGIQQFAAGGQPRFLSGGGDGMSDSIKASINGTQEARLADGEFVIPADVVSHLGNGSSKAGAKQLYSMMDRVRKARTGNPKQGKKINSRKYMPA
jgi:hypothetical protein